MKIKSWFRSLNQWLKDYALVLLLVLGGGYYFLSSGQDYYPEVSRTQSLSSSYGDGFTEEMAYDLDESMVQRAKGIAERVILPPNGNAQGFDPESLSDRKIIKNGSLQLEVEDTTEALALAKAELGAQAAFISHQRSYEVRRGVLAYNLTIRVPAENLETLSANLEKLGIKKSENYATTDITAQYRDTANRIKNLEVRRERLRELMSRETEDISDILEIERELTRVQTEIDQLSATQKQRDTDVSYSTLQLTLNPEPEIGDFSSPDWNLENSWKMAVNDFMRDARDIVDLLIRIVVYTPIWLPAFLILWGLKRLVFGRKKSKK